MGRAGPRDLRLHTSAIDASFDPEFGYPLVIKLSCPPNILDRGTTYYARNLKPQP